jgi:hypothetical protein
VAGEDVAGRRLFDRPVRTPSDGAGTKLSFDHDGFPEDQADHLAKGWKANYWENIAKAVS